MKTVEKICLNCSKNFTAKVKYIKRGHGKFCSLKCSAKYNSNNRPKPEMNTICALCKKHFYRPKSKLSDSKSGIYFCCREHKDIGQRIEHNIKEIQPHNYKNGESIYRNLAMRNLKQECAICGYNKHKQCLQVHHIDCDHNNNELSNLQILCANCHLARHFDLE